MLNFDNNATTPVAPEVLEELIRVTREIHGNSSSGHSIGVKAGDLLENCRKRVAKVLNAKLPSEIVFTSGGTESDNAAVRGIAWAMKDAGRGNHIITTAIEHRAVLAPCDWLAKHGYEVTVLGVDKNGRISLDEFKKALRPTTILVSVMLANNEIGTVQPIEQLGALAKTHGFILHTDAVQVAGKLPIDVQALGVHALSLSAHKFYGPKGVGVLYLRDSTPYTPFMLGGTHEYNKRAGTVAVPQIAAMALALELVEKKRQTKGAEVKRLRDLLVQLTLKDVPGTHVNGDLNLCTPNTASLRFDGLYGGHLLRKLDDEGVLASAGSACMWEQTKPSHVLTALGLTDPEGGSTLRFSLGFDNSEADVRELVSKLARLVPEIRKAPPQAIRPPKERVATH